MPTLSSSSSVKPTAQIVYISTTNVIEKINYGIVVAIVIGVIAGFAIVFGSIYTILRRVRQRKFDRISKDILNPVHDDTPL